jgi:hypothetical protein
MAINSDWIKASVSGRGQLYLASGACCARLDELEFIGRLTEKPFCQAGDLRAAVVNVRRHGYG